ncbi:MAG: T9SS type A sorting domain-containing protein [Bacteroidales bacterium]|nr:T9SS type A sorting domain-containing protein [Bacteroidales bacterium]
MKSKLYTKLIMVISTILMFTYIATAQNTTISIQILNDADDVEEATVVNGDDPAGTIDIDSGDLEFINEDVLQIVGMIFRNVTIPPGANIVNAYIQFTSDKELGGDSILCELYGASEANVAAPFTEDLFNVSIKTSTIATVAWKLGPWGVFGTATEAEQSPDISTIIQEIVTLDGWASGNNLMIGARGTLPGKIDNREAASFNAGPEYAPILNVTYNTYPVGENSINAEFSKSIYPNPTEGSFNIMNPSTDKFSYSIYSVTGKLVISRDNITGSEIAVDMSGFAKGMYLVDVRSAEKTEVHKLMLK